MAEERTYIPFTSRAKATTFDGILTEAHQIEDLDYGGAPKNQHDINAEVKANLARIEGIAGSAAAGAYVFKGSLEGLEDLLLLKNVKVGDVYNIQKAFSLSGGNYPAGTNVAATKAMSTSTADGWDALGGVTLDLTPINQEIEKLKAGKYDANKVVTTSTTNDDAHVLTAKATHDAAKSAATTAVNTFKTTNFEPLNKQVSMLEVNKADQTYVDDELAKKANNVHSHTVADISDFSAKVDEKITARVETNASGSTDSDTKVYSCKATNNLVDAGGQAVKNYVLQNFATLSKLDAKVVNNKDDKTSTDKALSAKATHEAIADALDVVAPDVTTLTTSVENIKKFVTVPFDGYETGAVTVQQMGTSDPVSIVYVVQKKCFAAKDAEGKFYNTWKEAEGIPAPECYFTVPTSPHAKKLYIYNHELYDIDTKRPVPLALILGQPITVQATGSDDTRSISQRLFTQEIAKYAPVSALKTLTDRVTALEELLKLA